jgi:predicted metallo-beta-lactamase superfamily hydrolase
MTATTAANRAPTRTAAEELLRSELRTGPRHGVEIIELAKARGISPSTLEKAKHELGIRSRRESRPGVSPGPGRWVWELDPAEQEADRRARLVDWIQKRSEQSDLPASERARLKRELDRFIRRQEARGGL